MRIETENENTILRDIKDFDLGQTLECGQCFHFEKIDENEYVTVSHGKMLHVKQEFHIQDTDEKIVDITLYNVTEEDLVKHWIHYFDLDRDYGKIKKNLLDMDSKLKEAVSEKWGVRILNQEFSETLMSFIISQNKQIPHIKQIVRAVSQKYGRYLGSVNDIKFYSFPTIEEMKNITADDYRELKAGFRASYLYDASIKLQQEGFDAQTLSNITYENAKEKLTEIKGVGEKVANCVLLFSLGFRGAFPVDVWIKRIMEDMYFGKETSKEEIEKFAILLYGQYGGYAQQYLFFYGRDKKIGAKK